MLVESPIDIEMARVSENKRERPKEWKQDKEREIERALLIESAKERFSESFGFDKFKLRKKSLLNLLFPAKIVLRKEVCIYIVNNCR